MITMKDFRLWVFVTSCYRCHVLTGQSESCQEDFLVGIGGDASLWGSLCRRMRWKESAPAGVRIVTPLRSRLVAGSVVSWEESEPTRGWRRTGWACSDPAGSDASQHLWPFSSLVFILTPAGTSEELSRLTLTVGGHLNITVLKENKSSRAAFWSL